MGLNCCDGLICSASILTMCMQTVWKNKKRKALIWIPEKLKIFLTGQVRTLSSTEVSFAIFFIRIQECLIKYLQKKKILSCFCSNSKNQCTSILNAVSDRNAFSDR